MKKLILTLSIIAVSISSEAQVWYNYGQEILDVWSPETDYFRAKLFPDSTVFTEFSGGLGRPWMHSLGQVLDPSSVRFEFGLTGSIPDNMNYRVDSLAFPYVYVRPQTAIPDTFHIQFFKQENLNLIEQPWPTWAGMEMASRASLDYDFNINRAPEPFLEIAEILDEADTTRLIQFKSFPIEVDIAAGEVIAATVTYAPGNPYNANDTLDYDYFIEPVNKINQARLFYYADPERTFDNLEYNHAFIASTAARYDDDSNGWDGQYWVGNASPLDFPIRHTDIRFLLTTTTVGVEGIEKNSAFKIFPNPADDQVVLKLENPNQKTEVALKVVDAQGRLIDQKMIGSAEIDANRITIDCSSYSSGIYFLRFEIDGFQYSEKLLVR